MTAKELAKRANELAALEDHRFDKLTGEQLLALASEARAFLEHAKPILSVLADKAVEKATRTMSYEEAANLLGKSKATVNKAITRYRQHVRDADPKGFAAWEAAREREERERKAERLQREAARLNALAEEMRRAD